jgi:Kdo2-lipid IVA lauroyltransferase/acyltransferase
VPQQNIPKFSSFLPPKYWPTWFGLGLLALVAYLPIRFRLFFGALLGKLLYIFAKDRRYIVATNIKLCFPELNISEQEKLVKDCFIENGRGLVDTIVGWFRNPKHFQHMLEIKNQEVVNDALAKGNGVIILGAHYTTLDFSASLVSLQIDLAATYRPHKNALFDAFMLRGRLKNTNGVFDRYNIRGIIRHLRKKNIIWYAPDQDYGEEHAVYAPFFGQQAATITAASRLAKINKSPVLLVRHHRNDITKKYEIEFYPFPEDYPGENDVADATYLNQQLERVIRLYPAQYMWTHKRFKTQAKGKPESPYIAIRTPIQKTNRQHFNTMIEGSKVIEEQHTKDLTRLLSNNVLIRILPRSSTKFFEKTPMQLFDTNARLLRLADIESIIIDNIFKIKRENFIAATYFQPAGEKLTNISMTELPLKELAKFLENVHHHGFFFKEIKLRKIYYSNNSFTIANPENIRAGKKSVSYLERFANIQDLLNRLKLSQKNRTEFIQVYTSSAKLEHEFKFTKLF